MTFASLLTEFFTSRGTQEYVGRHRGPRYPRYLAVSPVRSRASGAGDEPDPPRRVTDGRF